MIAVLVVAVLAFVPDPLFRYHLFATTFDDVEGVGPGTPVFFRGASVGEVRSVALDPDTRTFDVRLSVLKTLHPSACSYVSIASANPLVSPHIEIVAIEKPGPLCAAALQVAGCDPLSAHQSSAVPITGCRRAPDLLQTAATAVAEAAKVATVANQMAQRLQAMMTGTGSGGASSFDAAGLARNATETVTALHSLSVQLDRSFSPGKGDIALTLANVRRMSGRAATIDVASLNGILQETRSLVAQNQANIQGLLADAKGSMGQARAMLEDSSASLVSTSANLARASDSLSTLSEHIAADPTYVIRGQRFADPPAPGSKR